MSADRASAFAGTTGPHVPRRAAHVVAAGLLLSAPFVGPVILELLGRV